MSSNFTLLARYDAYHTNISLGQIFVSYFSNTPHTHCSNTQIQDRYSDRHIYINDNYSMDNGLHIHSMMQQLYNYTNTYTLVLFRFQTLHNAMTCFFAPCSGKNKDLNKCGVVGIQTLISKSQERDDSFLAELQSLLATSGDNASVTCHKTCYSSYTSTSRNLSRKK